MEVWQMNPLLAALVLLVSLVYLSTLNQYALLAIPVLSLLWWKMKGADIPIYLSIFFGFYLLLSSICRYAGNSMYLQFGVLAYVYFASGALICLIQYLVEKNDS
jgi:hypothetical protein